MGYNTTVLVLNDALNDIAEDPQFGSKLMAAVNKAVCYGGGVDVSACGHVNAATVIETHHADSYHTVLVGGNMGHSLGYAGHYSMDLATFEGKRNLLRQLAAHLGVKVRVSDSR